MHILTKTTHFFFAEYLSPSTIVLIFGSKATKT